MLDPFPALRVHVTIEYILELLYGNPCKAQLYAIWVQGPSGLTYCLSREVLNSSQVLVVSGGTGSGKTTQLPQLAGNVMF